MGATCTIQTLRNSLKFFSETFPPPPPPPQKKKKKKKLNGPLKNSGEQSRAVLALLSK